MVPVKDVASFIGTAGGAIVATVTVMKFLDSRREKQRQVVVKITRGFLTYDHGLGPEMLFVEAANPGSQPVTLESWGFLLRDRRTLVSFAPLDGTVRLPYELPPGKNCKMWMEETTLTEKLLESGHRKKAKLIGFYTDALGIKHKSKVFKFDLPHSA